VSGRWLVARFNHLYLNAFNLQHNATSLSIGKFNTIIAISIEIVNINGNAVVGQFEN
jgi:hypothetical protein